jgi:hypothetical protein
MTVAQDYAFNGVTRPKRVSGHIIAAIKFSKLDGPCWARCECQAQHLRIHATDPDTLIQRWNLHRAGKHPCSNRACPFARHVFGSGQSAPYCYAHQIEQTRVSVKRSRGQAVASGG